jgi:hypothetical protein
LIEKKREKNSHKHNMLFILPVAAKTAATHAVLHQGEQMEQATERIKSGLKNPDYNVQNNQTPCYWVAFSCERSGRADPRPDYRIFVAERAQRTRQALAATQQRAAELCSPASRKRSVAELDYDDPDDDARKLSSAAAKSRPEKATLCVCHNPFMLMNELNSAAATPAGNHHYLAGAIGPLPTEELAQRCLVAWNNSARAIAPRGVYGDTLAHLCDSSYYADVGIIFGSESDGEPCVGN